MAKGSKGRVAPWAVAMIVVALALAGAVGWLVWRDRPAVAPADLAMDMNLPENLPPPSSTPNPQPLPLPGPVPEPR